MGSLEIQLAMVMASNVTSTGSDKTRRSARGVLQYNVYVQEGLVNMRLGSCARDLQRGSNQHNYSGKCIRRWMAGASCPNASIMRSVIFFSGGAHAHTAVVL